ncbi:MAG: Adenylate kinase [Parcubacteria group bacterium GW2011_GWE2_38_18]|nr:MAG: Adenylate kinase [Parcubacteria group bacterium GW2011_GWE2_38_18]
MNKNYYIFFGPPGSGKGTQAKKIAEKLSMPIISTGEILRQEVELKSEIGKKAQKLMSQGKYVPDEVVGDLIVKRLRKKDAVNGAIFDGYPRTEFQQNFLTNKLKKFNTTGIFVAVKDAEVRRRLGGRRACVCGQTFHTKFKPAKKNGTCDACGGKLFIRSDDKPESIKTRLEVYHSLTEPLLKYWENNGRLIKVDGEQKIDNVYKEIVKKIVNF